MKTQASKTLKVAVAATAALARRKVALAVCVALCTVGLAFPQSDDKATIITFDAPDAGTGAGQGFPSTRQGRSRDSTVTQSPVTASCALWMVRSPRSTRRTT